MHTLSAEDFDAWLAAYGAAWEARDPAAAVRLFARDALYFWTPFGPPKEGHEGIAAAWGEATSRQRDVEFRYEIRCVSGRTGIATWHARFTRIATGLPVEIDGVLQAELDGSGACRVFREWWHGNEVVHGGRARREGPVGALMDELERAVDELLRVVEPLSEGELEAARGSGAEDEELGSIQKILNHVVRAGYAHANHLRVGLSSPWSRVEVPLAPKAEVAAQLREMLAYVEETLEGRWGMTDEAMAAVEIEARWGQTYDLEQMLEHAIVHVLRHRRQIERLLEGALHR